MGELVAGEADGRGLVLLLDIHMEGIQQHSHRRGIDPVDHLHRLRGSVEEARLEAIERFDCEADATLARVVGQRAQPFDQPVDGRGPFRVVHPPRLAGRGVHGTGHDARPDGDGRVDTGANVGLGGAIRSRSRRSRPSPITAQTDAPRSLAARISATRAGSQSPGFSTPISNRSKPIAFTRGAISAIAASVGGETQTQELTPIGFMRWLSNSVMTGGQWRTLRNSSNSVKRLSKVVGTLWHETGYRSPGGRRSRVGRDRKARRALANSRDGRSRDHPWVESRQGHDRTKARVQQA